MSIKLVGLLLLSSIFSLGVYACPQIGGLYYCTQVDYEGNVKSYELDVSQTSNSFTYIGEDSEFEMLLDGSTFSVFDEEDEMMTASAQCSSDDKIEVVMKGMYYPNNFPNNEGAYSILFDQVISKVDGVLTSITYITGGVNNWSRRVGLTTVCNEVVVGDTLIEEDRDVAVPIPTPHALAVDEVIDFTEGRVTNYKVLASVDEPGKPILKVEGLPKGATFDENTFELNWKPDFDAANDVNNPSIKVKDYPITFVLSSTEDRDGRNTRRFEVILRVKDNPRSWE